MGQDSGGVDSADAEAGAKSISQRRSSARREASAGYEQRRQRLLDAAAEVFQKKGFGATSVNDIAAGMGSDRASVYYYYGSKQEIYLDLIRQAVEQIVAVAEAAAVDTAPATVRLRQLFVGTMEGYERHYPYLHIFVQEDVRRLPPDSARVNSDLADWVGRFEASFVSIIEDGIERGEFRNSLDPKVAMFAMLGSINWSHRWFLPGGRLSGKDLGAQFAEMYLQGIRAPRSRSSRGRTKSP